MGRKKNLAKHSQKNGDNQHGSTSDIDTDYDGMNISDDPNAIEYKIIHAKHPFEKRKFIESRVVTPSQRAITCCIQMNNGWASAADLLQFLQNNWSFIGKLNSKLPNNMPDTRILHINLAVKKKNIPLFIQDPNKPHYWTVNSSTDFAQLQDKTKYNIPNQQPGEVSKVEGEVTPDEPTSLEEIYKMENKDSFEAHIHEALKSYEHGVTLEELAEATKKHEGEPGLFQILPHVRRVRAVLIVKKSIGEVFEKNGVWTCYTEPTKIPEVAHTDFYPACLRTVDVTELTLDEFYNIIKSSKV
ncbi:hypothetical protein TVAG_011130 [Trichomonas vaginalis G3]|uniref:Uncharacterized protein n=1 Tax=Trichomonas vaginalis (strain ATCC PRA-98 / G3) TaxID=412133 RepID=A2DP39_TRIV3|nr:hypothetical protein TVAGG3_0989140 [Trichomonas vaginalis G3]EAY17888.1 hypothetical protein TVAG_011130 [Trichomonas vaginalis G3]KAI5489894.1 hypothetical protein TVAGG3_0989140 [Trichomonas vaginalis G3]|eukprot:XP_001330023.1 hypothetical protein [Trichomonas vaginalis G3]